MGKIGLFKSVKKGGMEECGGEEVFISERSMRVFRF